jgi:hypothetical protein
LLLYRPAFLFPAEVIGNAEGHAKIVLAVGVSVGEAGADVVEFKRTDSEAPGNGDIGSGAELHGKGTGSGGCPGRSREGAVEAVRAAEESFGEDMGAGEPRQPEGITRTGHEADLAETNAGSDVRGVRAGKVGGHTEAAVEGHRRICTAAVEPELTPGGSSGQRARVGHSDIGGDVGLPAVTGILSYGHSTAQESGKDGSGEEHSSALNSVRHESPLLLDGKRHGGGVRESTRVPGHGYVIGLLGLTEVSGAGAATGQPGDCTESDKQQES